MTIYTDKGALNLMMANQKVNLSMSRGLSAGREHEFQPTGGWGVLFILFTFSLLLVGLGIGAGVLISEGMEAVGGTGLVLVIIASLITIVLWCGFFTVQPNQAVVCILFGAYKGTVRKEGFCWANPFLTKKKVSLRVRNMQTPQLKVNDLKGNPIEIAAVVVWRVEETFRATFEVDDYENFVKIQSESALRHLASSYPYDSHAETEKSLRGSMDEVSHTLQRELHERLAQAGVTVDETRLSHLAYAPEIAGAMLRRQQAEAVVAARYKIVEGAVGMVEEALSLLEKHDTLKLDEERKAAMVSNLMVVLCGDQNVHPVVNAGTLYSG